MKKTLLLISAFALSITVSGQVLDSENFNTLAIGDTHTAADLGFNGGPGEGGYFRSVLNGDATAVPAETTNNAGNSNVQIVANGLNSTRGMQITNPNGTGGFRQILKNGFQSSDWASRTAGNDVLDATISIFTGATTSSVTTNRFVVSAPDGSTIVAMDYDFNTREISGLGTLNNGGAIGLFAFSLGPDDTAGNPTALIAPANTWVTLTMSYNSTTGELIWATDLNGGTSEEFGTAAFVITGQIPDVNQIFGFSGDGNAAASSIIIDDFILTAVSRSTLSIEEDLLVNNEIKLFPNPATDVINVSSSILTVNNLKLVDLNGRVVMEKSIQNENSSLNVSDVASGIYLLNVTTGDTISTKRVIID
ncbi:T9SS type A sorting domain-containing protein [Nonlabens sp.]|uniref:T9SS type A sorting domain-containing protein n=2 Tax=Nonlabens sp. TaxID=1888209 RepID=UPI0032654871